MQGWLHARVVTCKGGYMQGWLHARAVTCNSSNVSMTHLMQYISACIPLFKFIQIYFNVSSGDKYVSATVPIL